MKTFVAKYFFPIIYKKSKMQQLRVTKTRPKNQHSFYIFNGKIKKFSCTSLCGILGFQTPKFPWKIFSCCFICALNSLDDSLPVYQVAKKEKHQEFHISTPFLAIFPPFFSLSLSAFPPQESTPNQGKLLLSLLNKTAIIKANLF